MGDQRSRRRQAALFLLGLLLFNAPLLTVVDRLNLPSGVPLTPLFVFVGWFALILLAVLNTRWRRT